MTIPTLRHDDVTLRPIRVRDARALEIALQENRTWLRRWEATVPRPVERWDTRAGIRALLAQARAGGGLPFIVEYQGRLVGQVNVSNMTYGSLSSATLGYWIVQDAAGHGITPTAVALATDHCFGALGMHRMEICIRPENDPSLRVVEKLGFRYEGLRRRYIHIDGDWRDHYAFALTTDEVPYGVLLRWLRGEVDESAAAHPSMDA